MLVLALVAACWCAGGAAGYAIGENLPPEQMEQFLTDVMFQAQAGLVSKKSLEDVDLRLGKVFLGIPIELALVTRNTSLVGPTTLNRYSAITGEQTATGSASIITTIDIGELKVEYSYLLVDLFGLKYEGVAELEVQEPRVDLTIHIYRNVLTECQVTTTVARPRGTMVLTLGESGSALRFATSVLGSLLSKTLVPQWLLSWSFFPDISPRLNQIIQEAAQKVACQ